MRPRRKPQGCALGGAWRWLPARRCARMRPAEAADEAVKAEAARKALAGWRARLVANAQHGQRWTAASARELVSGEFMTSASAVEASGFNVRFDAGLVASTSARSGRQPVAEPWGLTGSLYLVGGEACINPSAGAAGARWKLYGSAVSPLADTEVGPVAGVSESPAGTAVPWSRPVSPEVLSIELGPAPPAGPLQLRILPICRPY
ncbi:hypothetical protein CCMA1212_003472 [Trichoderma ghanense]|uniref:Uncharacterized protein n=1 Tax=Trichoderma ghanense TaxID=65468 RepID=A0ABY2H8T5_9HYPO